RDISKELELIAHIAEKNRSQELSEAMVKMGYWRYDVKKGQLWCSNQVFQILKLPNQADNIVNIDTLYKLVAPSGQQTVIDSVQESFDHLMPLSLSIPVKTSKGELKHIVLKGICEASMGELTTIYGVFQDISEQLAQAESLRLTKERLEQSQAFSNIGNWQWDIQSGQMFWSELTSPMFGDKPQSQTQEFEHFISQVHPGDRDSVVKAISRCVEQAQKYDIEHRVVWPDESIHWLHQQGDVIRDADGIATSMIGVVQDITERKNKETELQLFKQIIESSDQAIMVSNHSGHLIYANPAHQLTFRHEKDVSKHHFSDFLALDFEASVLHQNIEQSMTKKGHWSGELQSKRTDSSTFPAHVSLGQFEDPSNNLQYRFSISYDICDDIVQKQKLNQAKLDAESANRAKSEFLSSMSHELRTPLNAVLGFSQLLLRQKEVEFTHRITDNIEAIFKAGEHLLTLINGILDLAKIESGNRSPEFEAVNIKEVIDEAIHLITPQAQERGLSLQTPEGGKIPLLFSQRMVPVINGDFTMLKQAMLNYLSNAVKYNKENGIIFVTVDVNDTTQITRITVSDNGIGIAAESICELFIPFNRLGLENSNIQGTGIGLA
ncbi:MAG: PAS domain-containing protein, partial [Psychrosphaera sp.]|nr:PAS domain-containing protein [Psychrosphaera sp.]